MKVPCNKSSSYNNCLNSHVIWDLEERGLISYFKEKRNQEILHEGGNNSSGPKRMVGEIKVEDIPDRGGKTNPKQEKGINRTCSESRVGLSGLQPVLV